MIRYCIHPGPITSKNDGEQHFISAAQLMGLYGVPRRECIIDQTEWKRSPDGGYHIDPDSPYYPHVPPQGAICLGPLFHGDYRQTLAELEGRPHLFDRPDYSANDMRRMGDSLRARLAQKAGRQ